jgi:predicted pyridoxine 5'-phosphate oxidase superfamily flavin-nucleotide-binding protein
MAPAAFSIAPSGSWRKGKKEPNAERTHTMALKFLETVTTPAVRAAQARYYGAGRKLPPAPERDALTAEETDFLGARDSFYMATVTEDGWPYVQHRGGPPGFVKVLGPNQLGFADFAGNRQMVSTGNLAAGDRVALFFMDYPRRERLKLLGHARVLAAREHPALADQLAPAPALRGRVERLFLIDVIAFDWNCPKYITPRFTAAEVEVLTAPLRARIAELEAKVAATDPSRDGAG